MQYTGHGGTQYWASERLLTVAEVAGLKNGSRLPVVMSFNCLDGWFMDPSHPIRPWLRCSSGIRAAARSQPSRPPVDGVTPDQHAFRKILMTVMFKENVREIGKALDLAKRRYADQGGARYLIETMTLFGDPALRLPLAADAIASRLPACGAAVSVEDWPDNRLLDKYHEKTLSDSSTSKDGVFGRAGSVHDLWPSGRARARRHGRGPACIYFTATAGSDKILVEWETGTERDTLGFNLYRSEVSGVQRPEIGDTVSG